MVRVFSTVRSVVRLGQDSELSFLAGSIAFFAFFSLIPALLLAMAIVSLLGGETLAMQVVALTEAYLSAQGSAVIEEALTDRSGLLGASFVSAVGLLWSAFKVFRAIDIAFDRVYGAETTTSLPRQLLNGTVVMVTIASGIALLLAVRLFVVRLSPGLEQYAGPISIFVLVVGLIVALAPLYYIMPPYEIPVREIVPGTITAVCGLIVLRQLFRLYVSHASQYQAYGFLGAVLLFLLWLYFGALVLLAGTVVNVAIAESGGVSSRDGDDPVPVEADDRL